MIEVKAMSWKDFKKIQGEMGDNGLINGELILSYSSELSLEDIDNMSQIEAQKLIREASIANGFSVKEAEKNSEEAPTS